MTFFLSKESGGFEDSDMWLQFPARKRLSDNKVRQ